jgi:hypothetical protein
MTMEREEHVVDADGLKTPLPPSPAPPAAAPSDDAAGSSPPDLATSPAASRRWALLFALALALALAISDDAEASSPLALRGAAADVAPLSAALTMRAAAAHVASDTTPCHFVCVPINHAYGGLGHRLINAATSIMLALGTGYPCAELSFEVGDGLHGNYPGADGLFFVNDVESRGIGCFESCGLPVQHLAAPPAEVQNNITALGRWVLDTQQQACGLIMVEEFWLRSLEPVWHELQRLFHPSSPAALALKAQLLYSRAKLNIAIHVRVGDMTWTPLTYFAPCLRNVLGSLQNFSFQNAVDVWLFSETNLTSLETELAAAVQAFSSFPAVLRLDAQTSLPLLTFLYLTEADIFLASDSGFSWIATFMSTKPVVIVAPDSRFNNKRVNLGEQHQHILADSNGTLFTSTIALRRVAAAFGAGHQDV